MVKKLSPVGEARGDRFTPQPHPAPDRKLLSGSRNSLSVRDRSLLAAEGPAYSRTI